MREPYHIERTLTKHQWVEVLLNKEITYSKDLEILQAMYGFEEYKAAASQIGKLVGYTGKSAGGLNLEIGRYGKRVIAQYPIRLTKRSDGSERKWDIFFNGWQEGKFFIWQLKEDLRAALVETGLTGEIHYSEEIYKETGLKLIEGAKKIITVNAYERNAKARELCIKHYGTKCKVCEFDFEKTYGEIGKGFIHVHHLIKIADIGEEYEVDPILDLRPVCPNCHAMLHREEPPISIEELKSLINFK